MSKSGCFGMQWSKPTPGGQDIADKVKSIMQEIHGKPFEEYKAIDFIFAPVTSGRVEILHAYIVINVEIEVNKLYYHISVEQKREGFSIVTSLGAFVPRKSKDAPLEPLYYIAAQAMC